MKLTHPGYTVVYWYALCTYGVSLLLVLQSWIRVVYGNGLISENRHQYINKYLIFLSMFSVLMITILVIANSLLFPHYILVYTLAICLLGLSIVAALVALVSLGVKVLLVIKRRLADSATKLLCFFL